MVTTEAVTAGWHHGHRAPMGGGLPSVLQAPPLPQGGARDLESPQGLPRLPGGTPWAGLAVPSSSLFCDEPTGDAARDGTQSRGQPSTHQPCGTLLSAQWHLSHGTSPVAVLHPRTNSGVLWERPPAAGPAHPVSRSVRRPGLHQSPTCAKKPQTQSSSSARGAGVSRARGVGVQAQGSPPAGSSHGPRWQQQPWCLLSVSPALGSPAGLAQVTG